MSEITYNFHLPGHLQPTFYYPGPFFPDLPMPVFSSRPSACRVEAGRFEGVFSGNCTLMSIIPLNLLQIQIHNTALQYSFTNQEDKILIGWGAQRQCMHIAVWGAQRQCMRNARITVLSLKTCKSG